MKTKTKINPDVNVHILKDEELTPNRVADTLENLVASLNTNEDKRLYSQFTNRKQLSLKGNEQELNALYRTDWLSGKVVDIIPDDMTREWRSWTGDIDPDTVDILNREQERLALVNKWNLSHKWARLYGTGFLVMNIDDGGTPEEPLVMENIKKGGLRWVHAIDRHRVSQHEIVPVQDPLKENFGMPEWYRFNETSTRIHWTRLIRFDGLILPFDEARRNNYFGDSILARIYDSLIDFNTSTQGSSSMIYESNVDIMKIKGLMNYLQSAEGESLIRKRFTLGGLLKSFNNMLLLDTEEDYQSKTNTFAGLPDLIDRFALFLSAASDIPATRLLGSSASGLNATGEGDLKNYYDNVRSGQNVEYRPRLDYFDQIMIRSLGLNPDDDYSYEFNSLFQMTPQQEADIELKNAQRDQIYIDREVIKPSTAAKDLKQEGTYSNLTDEDIEELEEFETLKEEAAEEGLEALANGGIATTTNSEANGTGQAGEEEGGQGEEGATNNFT